jgi:hypothetical protein
MGIILPIFKFLRDLHTMYNKKITLVALLVLIMSGTLFAISTTQIDTVRNKEAIAETDSAIIEEFLNEAFSELLAKTDFSDVAALRNVIISKSTSITTSGKILYDQKYLMTFQNELADAFKEANGMKDGKIKNLLTVNLLMLAYDIGNFDAAKAALPYMQNSNVMIRYWAAKNFANPAVVSQLNQGQETDRKDTAGKILKAAQAEQSGDILVSYAQFAAGIKDAAGNNILTAIAQKRIDQYLAWAVTEEMSDDGILKALTDRIKTDADSTKEMAKHFATLYSLVVQRYIQGQQTISDTSKSYLASVIVQGDKYVPAFVPEWNGNFKRAIDKDLASVLAESDALFGSAAAAGKLPTTVGFEYDGATKTAPPVLTKPAAQKQ